MAIFCRCALTVLLIVTLFSGLSWAFVTNAKLNIDRSQVHPTALWLAIVLNGQGNTLDHSGRSLSPTGVTPEDISSKTRAAIERYGLDPRDLVVVNSRSYFLSTTFANANDAQTMCNDLGMVMVSLETEVEQRAVNNVLVSKGRPLTYITSGIYYNGFWKWMGSGTRVTYFNWGPGQPYHEGDSDLCIYNYATGWDDHDCNRDEYVLCEQVCP